MFLQKASDIILRQLDTVQSGVLKIEMPNGKTYDFGGKKAANDPVTLVIKDWRVFQNMIAKGDTGFAEDYRAGRWDTNDLTSLLTFGLMNEAALSRMVNGSKLSQIIARFSYALRKNTLDGSKKNIHAHYDLGNDFYRLWLDQSMTYSSALFKHADEDLFAGQLNKYDRLIDGIDQKPATSILEIGCGWGGFAERCAERMPNSSINSVTISDEQHAYASARLQDKASVIKQDYRLITGQYDHITSIEMFEAVGEDYWSTYFEKIKSLLKEKGNALIQTITIADDKFESYRKGSDVIRSLIFPGGMLPSPQKFRQVALNAGLRQTDTLEFGADYARTLEIWLKNFDAAYEHVKKLGFDDGFIRLWRFYLSSCIAGFKTGRINVMQAELRHV